MNNRVQSLSKTNEKAFKALQKTFETLEKAEKLQKQKDHEKAKKNIWLNYQQQELLN